MNKTKSKTPRLFSLMASAFMLASQVAYALPQTKPEAQRVDMVQLEKDFLAAQAKGKVDKEAELAYSMGEEYWQTGNYQKAEQSFRAALTAEEKLAQSGGKKQETNSAFVGRIHVRIALAQVLIHEDKKDGKLDEAIKLYEEAIAVCKELKKQEESAKIMPQLASIYIKLGNLPKAIEIYNNTREIAKSVKNIECEIVALTGLATVSRLQKNNEQALKYLLEAKEKADVELDSLAFGRILFELGRTYSDMSLPPKAIEFYTQAAKEFEDAGEPDMQGRVLVEMGQSYLIERNSKEAINALSKALPMLENEKDLSSTASCLIALGAAKADIGQFDEAQADHARAQEIASKANNQRLELEAISEQGFDYFLNGSTEKALQKFLKAKVLMEKAGNFSKIQQANVLRDCGMGYRSVGQTEMATRYYKDAATLFGLSQRPVEQAVMLDSMAVAYLDSGRLAEFEKYHAEAENVFNGADSANSQKSGTASDSSNTASTGGASAGVAHDKKAFNQKRVKASLAYNYAQYCLYKSRYSDALPIYEEALADYKEVGDKLGECHALRGLGLTYLILEQAGKAKKYYEEAATLADSIGNIESQWDCATGLGKSCLKLNDNQSARAHLEKAVALADKERRQFSRDSFKTKALSLREDCFLDLIDLLNQDQKFDLALEIAEKGRARAFLDMLEGRRESSAVNSPIARVSSTLVEDETIPGVDTKKAPTQVAYAPNIQAVGGETGFRAVSVVPKTPTVLEASAVSSVNARAPNIAEIKKLVNKNGSCVVEYVLMPKKLLIWVISPDGEKIVARSKNIEVGQLKELIRQNHLAITTSPKDTQDMHRLNELRESTLKKLYSILIEPVADLLPANSEQELTIVPYGPLFMVPFAALQASDGKFLIEKYTLNFLPAIAVLRATQEIASEVASAPDSLLAFGNPITEQNKFLGKLPYAEKEVKKVATYFDPASTKMEVGDAATKAKFREFATKYSYIHLATHGLVDELHPMDSSVVLAPSGGDDGLLSVKDILELPSLKSKLIVLSACQTGRGQITGDGVIGLSRAFIIAGTPSILVSQWNVDDVMTEYQMGLLYSEMIKQSDKNKARSLRNAQLKTIQFMEKGLTSRDADESAKKLRANPRYWAAFQLIGEYK
ncbi:MAG: CHAT domain-containing protein [Cyanobacteria bacterium TGS_CYA1]|nr:CHAT domain-containing protein [Cyanobacteria bacterium TGS_CYA1]